MAKNQKNYNTPVGIKDGNLYLVNYTFEDEMHGEPFKGVTGAVLAPLSQEYIDEKNDPEEIKEYYREFWVESVRNGDTELGLEEYVSNIHESYGDGAFPGHDTSYTSHIDIDSELVKTHFPDAVDFECIGGGRCFEKDMDFDVVLDEFLVSEINRLEK